MAFNKGWHFFHKDDISLIRDSISLIWVGLSFKGNGLSLIRDNVNKGRPQKVLSQYMSDF